MDPPEDDRVRDRKDADDDLKRPWLVATFALFAVGAADPARTGDVLKGIWAVESLTLNGRRLPADPTAGPQFTAFDGKEYVQRQGQTITEEGSYEVDPSKKPPAVDFLIKKGPDAGKRSSGFTSSKATPSASASRPGVNEASGVVRRDVGEPSGRQPAFQALTGVPMPASPEIKTRRCPRAGVRYND